MLRGVQDRGDRAAFTLVELLVVVAIITLLLSLLLPSINGARRQAMASKCAANLHDIGLSFAIYVGNNQDTYPPAFVWPYNWRGDYDLANQPSSVTAEFGDFGVAHWSWFLYREGKVRPGTFECPAMPMGGAPRTNPGPDGSWERGQRDQEGNSFDSPAPRPADKQAPRMAYTANAALVPRNQFVAEPGERTSRCVQVTEVREPRDVILVTEFHWKWTVSAFYRDGRVISESHRPVHGFYNLFSNYDEYEAPEQGGWTYGDPSDPEYYGLQTARSIENAVGVLRGSMGTQVNAVGRHHPGGDRLGGTTNFLYTDGHVDRKTVLQTMKRREWGERFYSLNGQNNRVMGDW